MKFTVLNSLQDFLSLAFMLLIPTDRARTYYELELDRTFVYGFYKEGRFLAADKFDDETQAVWYIHLLPEDYKTGKTYKEYWGTMPNVVFKDGTDLYTYISIWNQLRKCQQKCDHKYFFMGDSTHQPLTTVNWSLRITNIFRRYTGVPVTPKEIRKMYITHINNQGATNAELKGAASAMHHSTKMQESVYNSQTIFDKIAPIMELNERMWKEASGSSESK